jgi:hypothetical protein
MTAAVSPVISQIYQQFNYGDLSIRRQNCIHISLHVISGAAPLPDEIKKYAKSIQTSHVGKLSPPLTQIKKYMINIYKQRAALSSQMYDYTRDEYTEKLTALLEQFKDEYAKFAQSGRIDAVQKISAEITSILYYALCKLQIQKSFTLRVSIEKYVCHSWFLCRDVPFINLINAPLAMLRSSHPLGLLYLTTLFHSFAEVHEYSLTYVIKRMYQKQFNLTKKEMSDRFPGYAI